MMKPRHTAVAAGVLLALAGTALWLSVDRTVPTGEPNTALSEVVSDSTPEPAAGGTMPAGAGSETGSAHPVALPSEPDPNPPYLDLFAGDTDGDGRISVDEWLALEVRPPIPKYWSDEEVVEAMEIQKARLRHASSSADPYHYYDDETKIALAEAGDWRARQDLLRLYSKTGRVDKLKYALLERLDTDDSDLARQLMTTAYNWRDRQPLLAAAFFSAAEELGFDSSLSIQAQWKTQVQEAGMTHEEMRAAGRELLAELREGGVR